MRAPRRFALRFACATLMLAASVGRDAQAQGGCSLLPGRPDESSESTTGALKTCSGYYWVRETNNGANRQKVAGLQFFVTEAPNVEEAVKLATRPLAPGFRTVAYGDGGSEKLEDANASDAPVRRGLGSLTGEQQTSSYNVSFRCGRYVVAGQAEPSKGIEARRLVTEMLGLMQSRGLCSVPATPSPAAPTPPQPKDTPPPQTAARSTFSVAGDCVRDRDTLFCAAQAANPPGGVPIAQVRYLWTLDGSPQGPRTQSLNLSALAPGRHVVTVRAFTPDTVYSDTFTIQVP